MVCLMALIIKGQTKAAAAFKCSFGDYGPILFKIVGSLLAINIIDNLLNGLYNQRPHWPLCTSLGLY